MELTVIIPTHNPDSGRLRRTLSALCQQTLPDAQWETILVDNASANGIDAAAFADALPRNLRVVREPRLGLTAARRRGLQEALAPVCVLVDDDNVLAPDYLAHVVRLFAEHPQIGAVGGKSVPEFEQAPAEWQREFFPLLALRDIGDRPLISQGLRDAATGRAAYPAFAPIGAGMALRREAVQRWLTDSSAAPLSDRRGGELSSAGDNDIVLTLLRHGWEVAYFPELSLTHLIPAARIDPPYLARLNRGIQKSWMQVLTKHGANPWPPIARWTAPLRKARAWFAYRAWSSPTTHIRWQGACGHFEGRISPLG